MNEEQRNVDKAFLEEQAKLMEKYRQASADEEARLLFLKEQARPAKRGA